MEQGTMPGGYTVVQGQGGQAFMEQGTMAGGYTVVQGQGGQAFMEQGTMPGGCTVVQGQGSQAFMEQGSMAGGCTVGQGPGGQAFMEQGTMAGGFTVVQGQGGQAFMEQGTMPGGYTVVQGQGGQAFMEQRTMPGGCTVVQGQGGQTFMEPGAMAGGYTIGQGQGGQAFMEQGTMAGGFTVVHGQGGQTFMEPVATSVPVDAGSIQAGFPAVSGHPCQLVPGGPSPVQTANTIQIIGNQGTQAVQGNQMFMEPVAGNFASMAGQAGHVHGSAPVQMPGVQIPAGQVATAMQVGATSCPVGAVVPTASGVVTHAAPGTMVVSAAGGTRPVTSCVASGAVGMGGVFSNTCGTMAAGGVGGGGMAGMAMFSGGNLKAGSITDDVFNMVDRNQDGVISRSEFRGALKGNIIAASQTTRSALGR